MANITIKNKQQEEYERRRREQEAYERRRQRERYEYEQRQRNQRYRSNPIHHANNKIEDSLKVLELDPSIRNWDVVNKQYRKLVVKWHPDKNPENKAYAEEKIRQINVAHDILKAALA